MLCDPRGGGCGNIRPLSCYVRTEASPQPKPLCIYCIDIESTSGGQDQASTSNNIFNTPEGEDLCFCRSAYHTTTTFEDRAMEARNFRRREPAVKDSHALQYFRVRRVASCEDCYRYEVKVAAAVAATDALVATAVDSGEAAAIPTTVVSKKKQRKASSAGMITKTRSGSNETAETVTATTTTLPDSFVVPLVYYPPLIGPPARLDHLRSDYFVLSTAGKKKWWNAAIDNALRQEPGTYVSTADEAAKIAAIIDGAATAECATCGEEKKVERDFGIKIWVTDGSLVIEANDECLNCEG